jgi:iron complex transport system permease protein
MIRAARLRSTTTLASLALVLVSVAVMSLELGSTRMSWPRVAATLAGRGEWLESLVIFEMRMPRIALGAMIGAGLATAGVVLQGITRNELASPSTVGVTAGSGLGMVFLLVVFPAATARLPLLLPAGAVVGAAAITVLVFALAYRQGTVLPRRLLLVGIAVGYGASAAMLLFSLRMDFVTYNRVVTWISGTLAAADWKSILLLLPFCLVLIAAALSQSRVLNVLALGDGVAAGLGVAVERQRLVLLAVATVLTSACVAIAGHIGFLGLVAPHLARRLVGQNHAVVFPAAALCGAILLVAADSLGRHLLAPIEVPAGVLVGALGGVYFLYLLVTTKG